jgi:hypothetical protein
MRIKPDFNKELSGEAYMSDMRFELDLEEIDAEYMTKRQFLESKCAGKKIIHVGFVDHTTATIDNKLGKNTWLHKNLCDVANRCYGIDINQEGVEYVKNEKGYTDVECSNILETRSDKIFSGTWDYLLVPDVLEHQNNPVSFLTHLAEKFSGVVNAIMITVPNAFTPVNIKNARSNIEAINSDHRFWFSPYTLSKVIVESGLTMESIHTCRNGTIKPWTFFKNAYFRRHPFLRNTIIAIVKW